MSIAIRMTMNNNALFHLLSWMSPSFPVGAYTYSHGIEYAVEAGLITRRDDLVPWIADILEFGGGRSDAILLAAAYRATKKMDMAALKDIAEIGHANAPTKEIALETTQQGRAFISVMMDISEEARSLEKLKAYWSGPVIHPVAVGIAAADHDIPLSQTIAAYLHGFVSNLVSAAVRLVPLGQTDGQRAIAALAGEVARLTNEAENSTVEGLGSATLMVDWCSALHETQYTRLFRS
ncbi:urease accessory protein UreF [Sneathiella sp.]|jgi:urease accessory protein|uniref:urease accessory protein UreF n=1 Tax=Sneathiella sp. TaxID=1964365 RepID=UPI0025EB416A|nr:urease accessory protein UreF [Sneathiella sp.]|tara:strand:- start:189 stop:896 length:708 start_codon:yes stop_codon:yes gene_type:complete